jgi:hypothetical protein
LAGAFMTWRCGAPYEGSQYNGGENCGHPFDLFHD